MASDRKRAMEDVVPNSDEVSEPSALTSVMSSAHAFKHELAKRKEENRHAESIKSMEINAAAAEQHRSLGLFGRYLGGPANAPVAVASIGVFAGLLCVFYCLYQGAKSQKPDAWFHEAEWAGAFAATSLSFIFGRAAKIEHLGQAYFAPPLP